PPSPSPLFPYTTLFRSHSPRLLLRARIFRPNTSPARCARSLPTEIVHRRLAFFRRSRTRPRASQGRHVSDRYSSETPRRHSAPRSEEHTSELQSRGHLV